MEGHIICLSNTWTTTPSPPPPPPPPPTTTTTTTTTNPFYAPKNTNSPMFYLSPNRYILSPSHVEQSEPPWQIRSCVVASEDVTLVDDLQRLRPKTILARGDMYVRDMGERYVFFILVGLIWVKKLYLMGWDGGYDRESLGGCCIFKSPIWLTWR